jgi:hypothetical protein
MRLRTHQVVKEPNWSRLEPGVRTVVRVEPRSATSRRDLQSQVLVTLGFGSGDGVYISRRFRAVNPAGDFFFSPPSRFAH